MGERLVLMKPDAGGAETAIVVEQPLEFLKLPGFEVVQRLPVICFREMVGATCGPGSCNMFLSDEDPA